MRSYEGMNAAHRPPPGPRKPRLLTLRCRGLRITTNDSQHAPVAAQVWEGDRCLAGPFDRLDQAVAWIAARQPRHSMISDPIRPGCARLHNSKVACRDARAVIWIV